MTRLPRPRLIVLDSGAELLYQRNPFSPTAAFGVWIKQGSRDESAAERGMSHVLEHMVFRGTRSRSALDIALDLEAIGGQWDAFTGKEATCYHGRVLDEHVPALVEILGDVVLHPSLEAEALRTELQVIREEIRGVDDHPEETTFEYFYRRLFRGSQLGHPVAGTLGDIRRITRDRLRRFHRRTYTASEMLFGFVGNLPPARVASLIDERFAPPAGRLRSRRRVGRSLGPAPRSARRPGWSQTHVCIGARTVPAADPLRIPLLLVGNILGGGVSSRMFQSLRERTGLAYAVFSHVNFWRDTGDISVYFSVDPRNLRAALEIFHGEMEALREGGVRAEELASAKAQLKGAIMLGLESAEMRLFRLFHNRVYYGGHREVSCVLREIDRVDARAAGAALRRFLAPRRLVRIVCGPARPPVERARRGGAAAGAGEHGR